ncbi:hypothetical protein GCM10012286_35420 [Streptomyces lasiicapitis]|uniref:Uncharacterized protein n=1 Tax=Streptomyces lasiicapitis TaxID=1923961 RepID=A0ABQ2M1U8_9ACTN|nr:hypothetical protein GCM10012286_35420 [Streptomyces lasiicapitis]
MFRRRVFEGVAAGHLGQAAARPWLSYEVGGSWKLLAGYCTRYQEHYPFNFRGLLSRDPP